MAGLKTLTINGVTYELTPKAIGAAISAKVIETGMDLNSVVDSGMYRIQTNNVNAPPGTDWGQLLVIYGGSDSITQIACAYSTNTLWIRSGSPPEVGGNGSWGKWECANPPMAPGEEYRTTERYQGAVVYKKVDANGNILWRKETDTQWRLLSTASFVD